MLNGELPRPRVSVLLPVRDAAPWLPEAIDSLRSQTLEDIEIVAVDDGSTDDTPDLLRAWAATDLRVRIVTRPAEGIVAALEHARRLARAPLLARMDADDVAHPARLEHQLSRLDDDPALVACACGVEYFPDGRVQNGARAGTATRRSATQTASGDQSHGTHGRRPPYRRIRSFTTCPLRVAT